MWSTHLGSLRVLACAGALLIALLPPDRDDGAIVPPEVSRLGEQRRRSSEAAGGGADEEEEEEAEEEPHDANDHDENGSGSLPFGARSGHAASGGGHHHHHRLRIRRLIACTSLLGLAISLHRAIAQSAADGGPLSLIIVMRDAYRLYDEALLAISLTAPVGLLLASLATRGKPPPALLPALAALSVCSFTLLLGLPTSYLIPALAAALGYSHAHSHQSAAGVIGCTLGVCALSHGILHRTTGYISHIFESGGSGGGISLNTICMLLVAMSGLCSLAAGCSIIQAAREVQCSCLLIHALLLAFIESALIDEESDDSGDSVYPTPLLITTIIGGLFLCERLHGPGNSRGGNGGGSAREEEEEIEIARSSRRHRRLLPYGGYYSLHMVGAPLYYLIPPYLPIWTVPFSSHHSLSASISA